MTEGRDDNMRYRKKKINYNKLLKTNHRPRRKQYKIHHKQMTKYDIDNLVDMIRQMDFNALKVSRHIKNKQDSRFTSQLFQSVLLDNLGSLEKNIIEYSEIPVNFHNVQNFDKRVLIRDYKNYDGYNLCLVLSFTRNEVITAYWIEKDFSHEHTLNWNRYSSRLYISV